MKQQPLVSIVIPCYNYAKYVDDAIGSVFAQTYKNIELIVINDGSTDNSDDVIRQAQKKYTFKYFNQANRGIVATRNRGVRLATGQFLIQLDADDMLPKNYVQTLINAAAKQKVDIFYTAAKDLDTGRVVIDPPEFNIEILKHHNYIHASSMVRLEAIKKYKYDQYLNDKGLEDWDMFLMMCLDGATGLYVKEVSLQYRQHNDIKSRNEKIRNNNQELDAIRHILTKHITNHPKQIGYMISYLHFVDRLLIANRTNEDHVREIKNLKKENADLKQAIEYLQARISKLKNLPPLKLYFFTKSVWRSTFTKK